MSRCRTFAHARTAQRRGRDRLIRMPRSLFRPQGVVYSSAARESRLQFAQSSPPPAFWGGGRAGCNLGMSAGRCIAVRIFLAMSSVLMRAMRRSGALHFVHRISIPNTLRKSSDHRIYLDRRLGLSCSPGAGGGVAGAGTTSLREIACEERTPKYRVVCRRGGGTRAASRAMRASGESSIEVVPSDQGRLNSSFTFPSGRMCSRSLASGGLKM